MAAGSFASLHALVAVKRTDSWQGMPMQVGNVGSLEQRSGASTTLKQRHGEEKP
jgi:hypothetical protein